MAIITENEFIKMVNNHTNKFSINGIKTIYKFLETYDEEDQEEEGMKDVEYITSAFDEYQDEQQLRNNFEIPDDVEREFFESHFGCLLSIWSHSTGWIVQED